MQIVSGVGVPKGGAAGEVLAKISGSDFDAAWIPQAEPAAGPAVASSDTPPLNPAKDQLWWESDSGNLYIWYDDSTSRQWVQIGVGGGSGGGTAIGDVKQCFQTADHVGWIKLDGRATSTLSPRQQSAATALGFVTNLPDATNSVPIQNGGIMGAVSGSWVIAQANLPAVTLTASTETPTTTSAGGHVHTLNTTGAHDHYTAYYGGFDKGSTPEGIYWPDTPASLGNHTHTMDSQGAHTHTVSHAHTVPLGGSGTPLTPQAFAVNMFVYLGG